MPKEHERQADQIEHLVAEVLASSKYRDTSPALVRTIASQEIVKRRGTKDIIKAIKNKLHQVSGAYLPGNEDYQQWHTQLAEAASLNDSEHLKQTCRAIMNSHASTRERLPVLESFYSTLFAEVGPYQSILDVACGLNPLCIPWLPRVPSVPLTYYACDIHERLSDFLNNSFPLLGIQGTAWTQDVIQQPPEIEVDIAFIFKTLPCLEQVDKQASQRLLRAIRARHLFVSFPVASLGGRGKGMSANYEAHFQQLVADSPWRIQRYPFATELVFHLTH
ncbi:hypothetical protein [Ktedonospora formicarum]|uniref:16S rRNA (guanine(1405)-N(7))-methyltransferase n=1 Tax=Ktedonospora formicarum TaxID=2778364 RepID=A0A8J3HZS6_9CHLR|nr:hypothetical protein [Ktedonospora formicarum]GHO43642.1 16S rRNA methyltransferase [Ktedonospora formicarum]